MLIPQLRNKLVIAATLLCIINPSFAGTSKTSISFWDDDSRFINVPSAALYPEGLEYNAKTDEFILGSIRQGKVIAVSPSGKVRTLIKDKRLKSVVGIRVDEKRGRLLINSADFGVSERSKPSDKFSTVAVGIYDLATGEPIHYVNLADLRPNEKRFVNDLTVDDNGNAYVTDSLAAAIYKITPNGEASVFLSDERFRGKGFNLNGIQYHKDGFLLVAKKSDGSLFKVPLDRPSAFTEVNVTPVVGTDGLVLAKNNELIAITNKASGIESNTVFKLVSNDNWKSAQIKDNFKTGDVFPTTGIVKGDKIFVNYGRLNTLGKSLKEGKTLIQNFRIQEVGTL